MCENYKCFKITTIIIMLQPAITNMLKWKYKKDSAKKEDSAKIRKYKEELTRSFKSEK